jgi:8-oxo-dGTP pyrophosphatase MutT (NUDIX family)
MLEAIWTGLLVALLGWIASVLWNNRSRLSLLWVSLRPSGEVRVSVASLLRVQDDDRYVVVHSPYRPDSYGPLGGVVKYLPAARPALDRLRFREEPRVDQRMRNDLRGFLPARALPGFVRWFDRQENRETALDCIRRELVEELGEIGHPELASDIDRLHFTHVRHVVDGPLKVPGHTYRRLRLFDVWDLTLDTPEAVRLREALVTLAADPLDRGAVLVTSSDILHGRHERAYVAPQAAYLMGDRRFHSDLPPLR